MSFQKQQESGYMALAIVDHGKITNIQLTASPFGVVTAVGNCMGGS
jgi:hypothetical protein